MHYFRYSSMSSVERRSSGVSGERGYSDRRGPEMERRSGGVKEVGVERSSGRGDERYSRYASVVLTAKLLRVELID